MKKEEAIKYISKAADLVEKYKQDKIISIREFLKSDNLEDNWEIFCSVPLEWLKESDYGTDYDPEVVVNEDFHEFGIDKYQTVDVRKHINSMESKMEDPNAIYNEYSKQTAAEWLREYKEKAINGFIGTMIHDW